MKSITMNICNRLIKIVDGTKTQTVNVSSLSNSRKYDYTVRIPRSFWVTKPMLAQQNFQSIQQLISFLEQHHFGKVENKKPISRPEPTDSTDKDYNEDKIKQVVKESLRSRPHTFYRNEENPFLNYSENTLDTNRPYIEVIAEQLVNLYDDFKRIGVGIPIRSTKRFSVLHDGNPNIKARIRRDGEATYSEKLLAIALFNSPTAYSIGKIFDYEIPLSEKRGDGLGKIDLVAKEVNTQTIKIIELKIAQEKGQDETLLRALLEVYTYYKLIAPHLQKFLKDYGMLSKSNWKFQPAILTDENSLSGQTLKTIQRYSQFKNFVHMINHEIGIEVEFFVYDYPHRFQPFTFKDSVREEYPILTGNITITKIPV